VALPRTAVHDGLGHILSLKPEIGLGFKKTPIIIMRAVTRASSWLWSNRHTKQTNSGAEQNGVLLFGVCSRTNGPNRGPSVRLLPNSASVRRPVGLPPAATTDTRGERAPCVARGGEGGGASAAVARRTSHCQIGSVGPSPRCRRVPTPPTGLASLRLSLPLPLTLPFCSPACGLAGLAVRATMCAG